MRFAIILLVLLLSSCSKKDSGPADPAQTATGAPAEAETLSTAKPEAPAPEEHFPEPTITPRKEWGKAGLRLVTPGKAPLSKLRRTFKKGQKQTLEVRAALTAGGRAGRSVSPMKPFPSIDYMLTMVTKGVSRDGSKADVAFVVDKVAVEPTETESQLVQDMESAAESIQGLRGRYSIDSSGRADKIEIDALKGATFRTHQMMETLTQVLRALNVPLPEQEVGEGAQWVVVHTIEQHAARVDQQVTYAIAKINGSLVDIQMKVEQMAAEQRVTPRGEPRQELTLVELQSAGTGEGAWDLTKLAPQSLKADLTVKSSFLNPRPGGHLLGMEAFQERTLTLQTK